MISSYLNIYFRRHNAFVEHGAVMQRMVMAVAVASVVIYITNIIVIIVTRAINLNAVIYVTMMVFGHSGWWIINAATAATAFSAAAAPMTNVIAVKIA